ncbi:hypothetical protein NECAME_09514 [Necator americanus]|uniref:Serine-threonine/tyrosine-protein kinase catalytic domain-containing protein n=1 Tax=Necator americanus TaxID=51031 RepID=W2TE90_NECAM|nr:hypothetical protein NECAME_09514 [Necator americanus]ETN79904.1 hypothetical protein NECAME_09514 [Necator americanus]
MDAVDISTSRRSFASSVQTTPFVSEGDQFEVRVYRDEKVLVTKHSQMELTSAEYDTCVKMRSMDHENVNKFIGLSFDGPIIMKDIISIDSMTAADLFFALCLIKDIAEGSI